MRRLSLLLFLAMPFVIVPQALAAPSPTQTAAHDPSVNTVSGFTGSPNTDQPENQPQPGDTPEQAAARQFPANSIETFRFRIAPGESNRSFAVSVGWGNAARDFDIFVYRIRANGTLVRDNLASAATTADPEVAEYASPLSGEPLRPSEFLVVVHNWCDNSSDPGGASQCPGANDPDGPGGSAEDNWTAEVTFTEFSPVNQSPSVTLAGPTSGRTGEALTYTARPSDPDGKIDSIAFDLDGDGVHETNNGTNPTATARFATAGRYSVGVRVIDNNGEPAFASVDVRVTGPAVPGAGTTRVAPLLSSFKLRGPVFGGRKNRKLSVRYRLRERATVRLTLYRGKRVVRRLVRNRTQRANRTFRVLVRPRGLRRGAVHRVQIVVRSTDGTRRQSAVLKAKRL